MFLNELAQMLIQGQEFETNGKQYILIYRLPTQFALAVEKDSELPAQVFLIDLLSPEKRAQIKREQQ